MVYFYKLSLNILSINSQIKNYRIGSISMTQNNITYENWSDHMIALKHFIFATIVYMLPLMNQSYFVSVDDHNIHPVTIATYEEDITGDGTKEKIALKGHLLAKDSDYYRDVWAEISSQYGEKWKVHYKGGYNPRLQFINLTNDDVKNIYYQAANHPNGGSYHYSLHVLKNNAIHDIQLPEQDHVIGNYKDNFRIEISLAHDENPIIIDMSSQAEDYIDQGIYDEEGTLLHSTSVHIQEVLLFEPILQSPSTGYALKSYQHIKGSSDKDEIGTIETLWYYENDTWSIIKTKCVTTQ